MYKISNADFLYVLTTFVVVPKRMLDAFGWRRPVGAVGGRGFILPSLHR